jgi:hypothetical protein
VLCFNVNPSRYCVWDTGWKIEESCLYSWQGPYISSLQFPDRLWDPRSLLSTRYRRISSSVQSCCGVKLTTHLNLVSKLRIRRATPCTFSPAFVFVTSCPFSSLKLNFFEVIHKNEPPLWSSGQSSGCRSRGPRFNSRRYQIF